MSDILNNDVMHDHLTKLQEATFLCNNDSASIYSFSPEPFQFTVVPGFAFDHLRP